MSSRRRQAAYVAAASAVVSDGPVRFTQRVAAVPRLTRDVLLGRWSGLSRGRLGLMALAVLYILSPVDLLPEAVLTLPGLADDAAVAAWLIASLFGATSSYLTWDDEQVSAASAPGTATRVVPGEVIPS